MNSSEALTSNRKSATTDWATLVLLVKGNIGPGCLAMPYIFSMLGPVWSVPALLGVALVCVYNMWLLAQCKKRVDGAKTYGELGLAAFGRTGELVVELFLIAMQLSICCVYFSFIGDSLFPLFGVDKKIVTVALIFPVLLITQLRHMRQLAPLSLIAFVCLAVAMLMIVSVCVERIYEEAPSAKHPYQSSVLMLFFVSTVYAFEGIGIVLPIEESMQSPNNFSFILCVAMVVVITVYILFAEVVLMAFGEIDDAGITGFLEGQGSISPLVSGSISILISLAVFLSYPLQLYPALQVIEIYCGYTGDRAAYSSKTCWVQWLCCDCIADNTMSFTPSEDSKYKSPEYKRRRPPLVCIFVECTWDDLSFVCCSLGSAFDIVSISMAMLPERTDRYLVSTKECMEWGPLTIVTVDSLRTVLHTIIRTNPALTVVTRFLCIFPRHRRQEFMEDMLLDRSHLSPRRLEAGGRVHIMYIRTLLMQTLISTTPLSSIRGSFLDLLFELLLLYPQPLLRRLFLMSAC
mmetsp:Transcript_4761/g.7224  ORF Transcript_4761/g.7224 Transcript_4761/m.7224 type:complete len:518 (+) Transcript_4761:137-1690(+)